MADVLPWLNLLLFPVLGVLLSVSRELGGLGATQEAHGQRLERLEAVEGLQGARR